MCYRNFYQALVVLERHKLSIFLWMMNRKSGTLEIIFLDIEEIMKEAGKKITRN